MTEPRLRHLIRCWLILAGLSLSGWACEPAPDQPPATASMRAQLIQAKVLTYDGTFMVTPSWAPEGDRLLVWGHRGIGLYLLDPDRNQIQIIDRAYRGRARLARGGAIQYLARVDDLSTDLVFESPSVSVHYYERFGEVMAVTGGEARLLAKRAWSAKVSSDGALVAFCQDPLLRPTLRVVDMSGADFAIVSGADPVWIPGTHSLVYARPEAQPGPDGRDRLIGSDLFLLDLETGLTAQLTHSPDVWEMQPAVSPDGGRLAYSDWNQGTIGLAELRRKAGVR